MTLKRKASVLDYLKHAFLFRWNLLFFLGATGAAAISGHADVLVPLVMAGELTYLAGLTSIPKFRQAIDVRVYEDAKALPASAAQPAAQQLDSMMARLVPENLMRFQRLRQRCLDMSQIADEVRGKADRSGPHEDLRTPALDRLLWVFLRLLFSHQALREFLAATQEAEIRSRIDAAAKRLTTAEQAGDERLIRALNDALATERLRLDNYQKAQSNAEFVAVEIDRIEGKIKALVEMAVSNQDPDFITRQVDSVAASMAQTEQTIADLNQITGLSEDIAEPPPIIRQQVAIEG